MTADEDELPRAAAVHVDRELFVGLVEHEMVFALAQHVTPHLRFA